MKTMDPTRTTGRCPSCGTQQPTTAAGRIARHKSPTMRWSGRRWFRATCNGSDLSPAVSSVPGVISR